MPLICAPESGSNDTNVVEDAPPHQLLVVDLHMTAATGLAMAGARPSQLHHLMTLQVLSGACGSPSPRNRVACGGCTEGTRNVVSCCDRESRPFA